MSWDQQAYGFGHPNAQPPTPTQTPTGGQFPSPTFQTPRNSASFENNGGWTPTFAEEYSVFNATPGRLTSQHHFAETSPLLTRTPIPRPSTDKLDLAAAQAIGLGVVTRATQATQAQLSPNPGLLPAVDPVNVLSSSAPYSAGPSSQSRFDDAAKKITPRKPKKHLEEAFSGQTATPPQSSKGSRKLAPKMAAKSMHDIDTSETPTQVQQMMAFPDSAEFFGYAMSGPATAPVLSNARSFWDSDTHMGGMDLSAFSSVDPDVFEAAHRMNTSLNWSGDNQLFQDAMDLPDANLDHQSKAQRLAPKLSMQGVEQTSTSQAPYGVHGSLTSHGPFSQGSGALDPGLIFNQSAITTPLGYLAPAGSSSRPGTSHMLPEPYEHQLRESRRDQEELRRARIARESGIGHRPERGGARSPVKGLHRPSIQRSVSDSRGRISHDRASSRAGRSSPLKHQRPPSLTAIPESSMSKPQLEVKLTIDAHGRARTETVVVADPPPSRLRPVSASFERWESSDGESSTDEEPIVIPSRNTSFNLPRGRKPILARFDTSRRDPDKRRYSDSIHSRSGSSSQQSLAMGAESEAETVMEDLEGSGDATLELRKVVENRRNEQLKARNPRVRTYSSDVSLRTGSSQYDFSPTTSASRSNFTDADTPSTSRSGTTRCVCRVNDGKGFMIQCESCENWLHGRCVKIDSRSLPSVYICAFCAQTPKGRGGRLRDAGKGVLASSPLAHKSFKSFR